MQGARHVWALLLRLLVTDFGDLNHRNRREKYRSSGAFE
jgi:hypothetical protein